MGISRDSMHKRRATGGNKAAWRKKRKYELGRQPANTKLSSNKTVLITSIGRSVDALLKHKSQQSASKNPQLLPSDEFLYLILTLTKIPQKSRVNAFKIPLPNPLYSPENSEICLFVNDANSKIAKSKIDEEKLPIAKVIKLTKLKKEYKAYELKRKLCDSYDLFMAEKRIIPLLPNAIGKGFYKKKKIPVPIEMSRGNWKDQIDRICSSALLYLSTGSCSVIKIARVSMGRDEIVANVAAAIEGIANVVPKKWGNVRSFHLKLAESLALPVYQKVPELGFKIGSSIVDGVEKTVVEAVVKTKKEKKEKKKKTAKGRIHEVKYMDEVMVGEEEGTGNYSWGSEAVTRKTRILDVVYIASNNELVRTQTLVKSAIVQVDAAPFKQWYLQHYGVEIGRKKEAAAAAAKKEGEDGEATEETKKSNHVARKLEKRQQDRELDAHIEEQFGGGRLLACISSHPGQCGRCDGYILEGKELEFYMKMIQRKKGKSAA